MGHLWTKGLDFPLRQRDDLDFRQSFLHVSVLFPDDHLGVRCSITCLIDWAGRQRKEDGSLGSRISKLISKSGDGFTIRSESKFGDRLRQDVLFRGMHHCGCHASSTHGIPERLIRIECCCGKDQVGDRKSGQSVLLLSPICPWQSGIPFGCRVRTPRIRADDVNVVSNARHRFHQQPTEVAH